MSRLHQLNGHMVVIRIDVTACIAQELKVDDGQKLFQPAFTKAHGNVTRKVLREILDELPVILGNWPEDRRSNQPFDSYLFYFVPIEQSTSDSY